MTLVVHGRASSSNVQAVMWCAAELGLVVVRRDVGGPYGGTDTPAYRRMNPMGRVPVLQDGDVTLFESAAIQRYLLATYPSDALAHTPLTESWAEWAKWTLTRAFLEPVFWGYYRTPEDQRDMDRVRADLRRYEDLLDMAMQQRGPRDWLVGDQLSLADIWCGHMLYRYFTLDLERQVPDGLEDYYASLVARETFQTHVMIEYSELKGRMTF